MSDRAGSERHPDARAAERPPAVAIPSTLIPRRALLSILSGSMAEGRVTLVSAPPGSGKSVLVRSWIASSGLGKRTAWVAVDPEQAAEQRFWLRVIDALRGAIGADAFVENLAPAPEFHGDAVVARLASELRSLDESVVLVIDDLHLITAEQALAQLETLIAKRPPMLHIVLLTRHDPSLGLHRLRLDGMLTEIRMSDLSFSQAETEEFLASCGISLSAESSRLLHQRTEGWPAGLRLAAASLARHPDPERFVAEFSGSERSVADYLLGEALYGQPERVRTLLLRTAILERVNGALADALTDEPGSEAVLQSLEDENLFVTSLDASRSWFRYHQLFAEMLRLELRRTSPEIVTSLHAQASSWFEHHGFVVEAIRHAQAAEDWGRASRLLADHHASVALDGEGEATAALLDAFPPEWHSEPEVAIAYAEDQLVRGSLADADAYIRLAARRATSVPVERRRAFELALAIARLSLARRRGDFTAVLATVKSVSEHAEADSASEISLSNDGMAVAVASLGMVEYWSLRIVEAERHLEQGLAIARRIGRPYIEVGCLSHLALVVGRRSLVLQRERCAEALAIIQARGWQSHAVSAVTYIAIATLDVIQGRFEDAEDWLVRAESVLRTEVEPAPAALLHFLRGLQALGTNDLHRAVVQFQAAEALQSRLATTHPLTLVSRQCLVHTLLQLGDVDAARVTFGRITEEDRSWGEAAVCTASLHLCEKQAAAAIDAAAVALDGAPLVLHETRIEALLVTALARDSLGDAAAAHRAIEQALEVADPDSVLFPFVVVPVRELLERHLRRGTSHAALLSEVIAVLAGAPPRPRDEHPGEPCEDLSDSELRVLRYLPSHLSAPEIARELTVSTSTVKTHLRHIYAKLGVHRRTEAVDRARKLQLLGLRR